MTWFRVDDQFHDHPKVRKLRREAAECNALQVRGVTADEGRGIALGVWVACGSWAGANLSDGFVPAEVARRFDPDGIYCDLLVTVGLWHQETLDGEDGYRFHEWSEHQPTREKVLRDRVETKQRVAKHRAAKKAANAAANHPEPPPRGGRQESDQRAGNAVGNGVTNGVGNGVSNGGCNAVPTRPDPTNNRGTSDEESSRNVGEPSSQNFDIASKAIAATIGHSRPAAIRDGLARRATTLLDDGASPADLTAALMAWRTTPDARVTWLDHKLSDVVSRREQSRTGSAKSTTSERVQACLDRSAMYAEAERLGITDPVEQVAWLRQQTGEPETAMQRAMAGVIHLHDRKGIAS